MASNDIYLVDQQHLKKDFTKDDIISLNTREYMKSSYNLGFFVFVGTWFYVYKNVNRISGGSFGTMGKHLIGYSVGFLIQRLFLKYMLSGATPADSYVKNDLKF
jgi:hypothetical protein